MRVGVLALQGSAEPHLETLAALGAAPLAVRAPEQLEDLTHLVLPGGESTTIQHLLAHFELWQPLRTRFLAGRLVLFGTCAGAILLGRSDGQPPPRLQLLDAVLTRNAYGRQRESFTGALHLAGDEEQFHGVFIRAPRIQEVGPSCTVLGTRAEQPVLLGAPGLLAATFHPELTSDTRVHARFLALEPPGASIRPSAAVQRPA